MADGLSFIYFKLDMSHIDLKPANILKINDDYDIKITDFGISRIIPQQGKGLEGKPLPLNQSIHVIRNGREMV